MNRPSAEIGLPAVLKTRRFGYDGKGQASCAAPRRRRRAWHALGGVPLLLEGFVAVRARAVAARRARPGRRACVLPAGREPSPRAASCDGRWPRRRRSAPALQAQAVELRRRMLEELDYVGVLAIEFFDAGGRADRERDGAARPQLRPLDHRGRGDAASSRTTCAPSSACRSVRRRRSAAPRCST